MCGPAALVIAGAVVSVAGTAYAGLQQAGMASYGAKIAAQNKQLERDAAADAIDRGQEEQRRLGRQVAQKVGSQKARMAANNIDISTGSAARNVEDTESLGREDQATLSENIRREVKGHQINAWNYEQENRALKAQAKSAKIGTAFSVASTALGGASQYSKFKSGGG